MLACVYSLSRRLATPVDLYYVYNTFELTSPQPRSVYNVECCWCALKALLYVPNMLSRPCVWLCDLNICLLILILL